MEGQQTKLLPTILQDVHVDAQRLVQHTQEMQMNFERRKDNFYYSMRFTRYQVELLLSRMNMLEQAYSKDL